MRSWAAAVSVVIAALVASAVAGSAARMPPRTVVTFHGDALNVAAASDRVAWTDSVFRIHVESLRSRRESVQAYGVQYWAYGNDSQLTPEHGAEERVPPRRLGKRVRARQERRDAGLTARRVIAVDEVAERIERRVLGERHPEREPPGAHANVPPGLVERGPEQRAVREVEREPHRPPARAARHRLAEHGDVGVVVAEHPLVERLLQGPHGRRDRPGQR